MVHLTSKVIVAVADELLHLGIDHRGNLELDLYRIWANATTASLLEPDKKPPGTEMFDRRRPLTLCRRRPVTLVQGTVT